jgi:hypothetical protein
MGERKALIHVGTHKTGTKTIQSFLADNWDTFFRAGVYVPNTGRVELAPGEYSPGQHRLATADDALLQTLADELRDANCPNVLLSSEEFYPQLGSPDRLARLRSLLEGAGYECFVILYLRPQAGFAESMYAETAKGTRPPSFASYLKEIIERGARHPDSPYTLIFEYSRALQVLAAVFGSTNVIARAFQEGVAPSVLISDFVRTLATVLGSLDTPKLHVLEPSLNARQSFGSALQLFEAGAVLRLDLEGDERLNELFTPMLEHEEARVRERFASDNAQVEKMAGIRFTYHPLHDGPEGWERAAWQRQKLDALFGEHI